METSADGRRNQIALLTASALSFVTTLCGLFVARTLLLKSGQNETRNRPELRMVVVVLALDCLEALNKLISPVRNFSAVCYVQGMSVTVLGATPRSNILTCPLLSSAGQYLNTASFLFVPVCRVDWSADSELIVCRTDGPLCFRCTSFRCAVS